MAPPSATSGSATSPSTSPSSASSASSSAFHARRGGGGGGGGRGGRRGVALPAAMRAQPFWFFGLPMILFVVAGSLGLSQFAQAKYQVSDSKRLVSKEEKQNLRKPGEVFDLQQEYWRLQEQDKDDDWKIVPMPRPPVSGSDSA